MGVESRVIRPYMVIMGVESCPGVRTRHRERERERERESHEAKQIETSIQTTTHLEEPRQFAVSERHMRPRVVSQGADAVA